MNSYLTSCIKILEANTKGSQAFLIRKCPAPNANNVPQQRFQTATKRRKQTSLSLGKPTLPLEESVREQLYEMESTVCGVCHKVDDQSSAEKCSMGGVCKVQIVGPPRMHLYYKHCYKYHIM